MEAWAGHVTGTWIRVIDSSSLIHWFTAPWIHWCIDSLIHRHIIHEVGLPLDSLTDSFIDYFELIIHWFTAPSIHWLIHWLTESLFDCIIESLNHRLTTSLIHYFIGSFRQLRMDLFMSCQWHLNHQLFIRWCAAQLQQFIAFASQKLSCGLTDNKHVIFLTLPARRESGTGKSHAIFFRDLVNVLFWGFVSHHQNKYLELTSPIVGRCET